MDRLCEVIADSLEVERELIDENSGPGNPEDWDSVGHISVVSAIEEAFGVSLTINETLEVKTVADIRVILERKGCSTR